MTDSILRRAGYRERAFVKSYLASSGYLAEWEDALDSWTYDSHRDVVKGAIEGVGLVELKVEWEGSRSREILAEHEADESGLHQPDPAELYEQVSAALRTALVPLPEGVSERALKTAREVITEFLSEAFPAEAIAATVVVEEPEPGSYVVRLTVPRIWPWDLSPIVVKPGTSQREYLDDLASAYFAAPGDGKEQMLIRHAHEQACLRLGVDAAADLEQATKLQQVRREPRPWLLELAGALVTTLLPRPEEWLYAKPWADVDCSPDDYICAQAIEACAQAYARIGKPFDGGSVDVDHPWIGVLLSQLQASFISDGVDACAFREREMRRRIEAALRLSAA